MSISKHFLSQVKNQLKMIDYQAVTPPPPSKTVPNQECYV